MKIKTLYLKAVIQTKGYSNTLSSPKHKLEYIQEMDGYLVDGTTLIPSSNVAEVVVESEEFKPSIVTQEELVELPKEIKKVGSKK